MAAAKLNAQGLARKDIGLMSTIVPDPGHVFVSADLSAGEPTCTAHYSQDGAYYDATFRMVGKRPFYTPKDLLKIDSIYCTVLSVSPMGKQLARDLFNTDFGGCSFAERWADNGEYQGRPFQEFITKGQIKAQYAFHKIACLGLGYGMGPRKLQTASYDAGHVISLTQAREFYKVYWDLFSGIRAFSHRCAKTFKEKGHLVNDFGYRLVPDSEFKAFNYLIQSSVSGIMHVVGSQFFAYAPYCTYLLCIHDELVFSCPEGRVEEARTAMQRAEESLNAMLKWRVRVRIGFNTGKDLYSAK